MNARDKILEYLREKGPATSKRISEDLAMPIQTVYYSTWVLNLAGKIERYRGSRGLWQIKKEDKGEEKKE